MQETEKPSIVIDKQVFLRALDAHDEAVQYFRVNAHETIAKITKAMLHCFESGGKVLLAGNGGSAADCQHIAGELAGRFKLQRKPLPTISLSSDTSVITCIANDFDYSTIFSRQVDAIGCKGDIFWALSTSGSSPNILTAIEMAKKKEMLTISFTGKPGSLLEKKSSHCLCAHSGDTGHAQEIHQLAYHIICRNIDSFYSEQSSRL